MRATNLERHPTGVDRDRERKELAAVLLGRDEAHELTDGTVGWKVGYYVTLPNLYYRDTREFDASDDLDGRVDEIRNVIATLDYDTIARDAAALLRNAETDHRADANRVGVVGHCMSGPFAYALAGLDPDRVAAAASIHGVRLHGPGSPAQLTHAITGESYFACAEFDEYVSSEQMEQLDQHLREHNVRAHIEWYPRARHGFVFPSRTAAYSEAACEHHFDRILDLLSSNLGCDTPDSCSTLPVGVTRPDAEHERDEGSIGI